MPQVPYAYSLKTRRDHKAAPDTPFGTIPKDDLTTQYGAYGDCLECEPCVFPITVALSDIAISQAPSRGRL